MACWHRDKSLYQCDLHMRGQSKKPNEIATFFTTIILTSYNYFRFWFVSDRRSSAHPNQKEFSLRCHLSPVVSFRPELVHNLLWRSTFFDWPICLEYATDNWVRFRWSKTFFSSRASGFFCRLPRGRLPAEHGPKLFWMAGLHTADSFSAEMGKRSRCPVLAGLDLRRARPLRWELHNASVCSWLSCGGSTSVGLAPAVRCHPSVGFELHWSVCQWGWVATLEPRSVGALSVLWHRLELGLLRC